MADSVLVLLLGGEEIRVLYTEKFKPGDVSLLDIQQPGQDLLISLDFKATVEGIPDFIERQDDHNTTSYCR